MNFFFEGGGRVGGKTILFSTYNERWSFSGELWCVSQGVLNIFQALVFSKKKKVYFGENYEIKYKRPIILV